MLKSCAAVVLLVASLASTRVVMAQSCTLSNYQRTEAYTRLVDIPGISGVTNLTFTSADDGQASVTLPFAFTYLGTSFTTVNIGSNGYMTFGSETATSLSNQAPGNAAAPNNWIAPLWDDFLHPTTTNARWGVYGSPPGRVFVIEGGPATRYPSSGGTLYYQVRLFEGSERRFEFSATGNPMNVLSATVGYEGAAGNPSWPPLACGANCAAASGWNGQVFGATCTVPVGLQAFSVE